MGRGMHPPPLQPLPVALTTSSHHCAGPGMLCVLPEGVILGSVGRDSDDRTTTETASAAQSFPQDCTSPVHSTHEATGYCSPVAHSTRTMISSYPILSHLQPSHPIPSHRLIVAVRTQCIVHIAQCSLQAGCATP